MELKIFVCDRCGKRFEAVEMSDVMQICKVDIFGRRGSEIDLCFDCMKILEEIEQRNEKQALDETTAFAADGIIRRDNHRIK